MKSFIGSIMLVLLLATVGFAYPITTGEDVYLTYGSDAEFDVFAADGYRYSTFCLEKDVYITLNHYYEATIDDVVLASGNALSEGARKLYGMYLAGDLTTYANTSIQDAIWKYQGYSVATNDVYALALIDHAYDIKVLNLWENSKVDKQSQLIWQAAPVPEPASLVLVGLGMVAIGIGRKFKK